MNNIALRVTICLLLAIPVWTHTAFAALPAEATSPTPCDLLCTRQETPRPDATSYQRTWSLVDGRILATDIIPVTGDSYITSGDDQVLGSLGYLQVGAEPHVGTQIALAQADIRSIPSTGVILTATLESYVRPCGPGCEPAAISVHRVTRPWREDTVRWSTLYGAIEGHAYAVQNLDVGSGRWVSWEVTPLVSAWHAGTAANYGVAWRGWETTPDAGRVRSLVAREAGPTLSAHLIITWAPAPAEPFGDYP